VTASDPGGGPSIDERIVELTAAVHRAEPWSLGVTSLALARRLGVQETALLVELSRMVAAGSLERRFDYFALPGHAIALSPQQRELFASLLPPESDESPSRVDYYWLAYSVRNSEIAGIAKAFDTLLATGVLVRIGNSCYRGSQVAAMLRKIETHFRAHSRLTVAEFRDLVGTTRKYAVPLLAWFDQNGVTRRDGDGRVSGTAGASGERA
jgi:selenocysteine-specific elongation factor